MKPTPHSQKCPGHLRHWFTEYKKPGGMRPTCARCGAPNPKLRNRIETGADR